MLHKISVKIVLFWLEQGSNQKSFGLGQRRVIDLYCGIPYTEQIENCLIYISDSRFPSYT